MERKESKSRSREMDTMSNGKTWKSKVLKCLRPESNLTSTSHMEWNHLTCQLALRLSSAPTQVTVVETNSRKCAVSMLSWPIEEMEPRIRCSDAWTTSLHQSTSKWALETPRSTWSVLTLKAQPLTWDPLSWHQWFQWFSWPCTDQQDRPFS